MENPVLEKNLSYISAYSASLAQKIRNVNQLSHQIELVQNENQKYNMLFHGLSIHDCTDPEKEAGLILQGLEVNDMNTLHVIFGLGLGYLFTEFCDNAKGKILLFEPSVEILRATLEIVDFSKELENKDIFIVNDLSDFKEIYKFLFAFGMSTNFVFLNFYKLAFSKEYDELLKETTSLHSMCDSNSNFQCTEGANFLSAIYKKFDQRIQIPPLTSIENCFKDKPALVIAAGPSLKKNIEAIKKHRDKFVVFCVGTAYKALAANGIKPDFLNIIEMKNCTEQLHGSQTKDVNLILEACLNENFFDMEYKRKFMTLSQENKTNIWLLKILGFDLNNYETKGTVSYNALFSAKMLGCNPIVTVGLDLAYTEGQCYAKDSAYGGLECVKNEETGQYWVAPADYDEFVNVLRSKSNGIDVDDETFKSIVSSILKDLNNNITFVKGQNGEMLPTNTGYALFTEYFKDFALRNNKEIKLINASVGGAYIEGFEHAGLDETAQSLSEKIDVEEILSRIDVDYAPDIAMIKSKLEKEFRILSAAVQIFKREQVSVRNYQRELKRHRSLTPEVHKYLKKCLNTLVHLIDNYRDESAIFDIATFAEKAKLSWLIKDRDDKYDYDTQHKIGEAFYNYYFGACQKLEYSLDNIGQLIEALNESSDSTREKCVCSN